MLLHQLSQEFKSTTSYCLSPTLRMAFLLLQYSHAKVYECVLPMCFLRIDCPYNNKHVVKLVGCDCLSWPRAHPLFLFQAHSQRDDGHRRSNRVC